MEFYDLRVVSEADSRPTIRTTDKSVLVTVPLHLAEGAGLLEGTKLDVRFGEVGKQRALRLCKGSRWPATRRRNVLQMFVREVMPKSAVPPTELEFRVVEGGLELSLPVPWDLADPHVVVRPPAA